MLLMIIAEKEIDGTADGNKSASTEFYFDY